MDALLLAKLTVAPTFVVAVTLAGRRLGPAAAGMLAALPAVGGPILVLLALEQGVAFGAHAALAGAVGAATTMVFTLAYTVLAPHLRPLPALALAYLGFFALTAAFAALPVAFATAVVVPAATWWLVLRAFPVPDALPPPPTPPRFDLPARALATLTLVLLVTGVARALGPTLAGLVTPAPIATAVLATFTHARGGPAAVAVLLRALCRGLLSFTSFFVASGVLLPRVPMAVAFGGALAIALGVQAVVLGGGVGRPAARRPLSPLA